MRMTTKILAAGAGLAAIAASAPAAAQYGYNPYAYANPYGAYANPYGAYRMNTTSLATQQCTAAVQARLNNRVSVGSILGSMVGLPTASTGRVLSVTAVTPRSTRVTVRGLATSGRAMAYNPYGVGYYGALGAQFQPDLSFRCTVDYNGRVRDVDIFRR